MVSIGGLFSTSLISILGMSQDVSIGKCVNLLILRSSQVSWWILNEISLRVSRAGKCFYSLSMNHGLILFGVKPGSHPRLSPTILRTPKKLLFKLLWRPGLKFLGFISAWICLFQLCKQMPRSWNSGWGPPDNLEAWVQGLVGRVRPEVSTPLLPLSPPHCSILSPGKSGGLTKARGKGLFSWCE